MLRDPKLRPRNVNKKTRAGAQNAQEEQKPDSLEQSSPTDINSDEKVIVNEQREDKIVNTPSQTAANTSEGSSYDEEIIR